MKTRILIIGLAIGTLIAALTGCSSTSAQWKATGAIVGKRVAGVALKAVLSAAISPRDESRKQDFLWSTADALQANAASLVTADDVARLVDIWTPDKSHWVTLASSLADEYARTHPQNSAQRQATIDALAAGLREAAAK